MPYSFCRKSHLNRDRDRGMCSHWMIGRQNQEPTIATTDDTFNRTNVFAFTTILLHNVQHHGGLLVGSLKHVHENAFVDVFDF